MSERNDRRIPGRGPMVITIAAVLLVLAGGGYLWSRFAGVPASETPVAREEQGALPVVRPDETLAATLAIPGDGMLLAISTAIKRQPDAQLQAREAASAVLAHEGGKRSPVLRELRLRSLYLDSGGTAFLDLSSEQKDIRSSAQDELLAVYALVNTLIQNIPEVRQVRFLVDGREAQTLAGHIDLSRSFVKRMDLVKTP